MGDRARSEAGRRALRWVGVRRSAPRPGCASAGAASPPRPPDLPRFPAGPSLFPRGGGFQPLHAQPRPALHVELRAMHVSPHALPVLQTLQHDEEPVGPSELQAVASGVPLASRIVDSSGMMRNLLRIVNLLHESASLGAKIHPDAGGRSVADCPFSAPLPRPWRRSVAENPCYRLARAGWMRQSGHVIHRHRFRLPPCGGRAAGRRRACSATGHRPAPNHTRPNANAKNASPSGSPRECWRSL